MFARAFSISSKAPSDDSGRSQTARRPVQDSHLGELHAPRSPGSNGGSPRKPVANSNLSDGLSLRGPMAGSGDAPFVKNRSVTVSLASPALSSGEAPPTPSPVIHVQAATPNTSLYYVPNSRGKTGSAASTPTKRLPAADPGTALPPVTSLSRELSSSHFLANQMAALSFNREVDSKSPATMLPGLSDSTLVIDRTPSAASLLSVPPLSNQPSMASIDGHYGAGSVTRSPSTVGPPRRRPVTATDTSKRMPTTAYIVEEGPPKYPLARDLSQISIAPSMNRSYAPSIISSAAHSPRLPAGPSPRLPHVDSYASLASFISKESNATCGTVASMARALPHLPPLQVWSQRMPEQAKRVHEDEKERQNIISEFIHSLQKHLMEIRTQNELYRNPLVNMSYMKEKEADTYFAKELLERIAAELITLLTDLENRADAHHFILYFADLIPDALQTLVPLYARYCATTEARKGFFDAVPTRKTAIEQRVAETSSKSWAKLDNIRVAIELHLVDWRKVLERLAQVMKPSHHEYQAILRALEMVKGALQYIEKWSGELAIAHEHAVARSSVRDFELLSRDYINVDSDAKHAELQTAFIHSGGIKAWEPVGGLWHVMVCATDADQTPTRSSRIFSGMHASKPKSRPAEPAILCLYTDRRFMLLRGKDLSRETTVVALGRVCFAELRQGYALAKASLPDTVKISAKCELEFSFTVIPVSAPGKTDGDFARALVRALEATKRPSGEKLLANKEWEDVARTHGWEHVTAASLELVRPVRDDSVAPRSPTKLHGHAGPSNLTPRLERKDTMSGVAGLKRAFSTRFGRGEM